MDYSNDIAIIGLSGVYSGAENPDILWEKLIDGIDLNIDIKDGNEDKEGYVNRCSFIENVDCFDNEVFNFTPYEAKVTDPQHRVLLECCFKALENAGYAKDNDKKYISVFASSTISTYLLNNIEKNSEFDSDEINYNVLIGNDKDFLATRVAYKFNLRGAALTIQCACSSSLVSLHYACQSLLNYECDAALVGAVSISIPQKKGYRYKSGAIFSNDGYCRPFDDESSGTIKGNGCSVILIKRLDDAIKDNDNIYAVIKGTAINNDGSSKIGFTAPSIEGESAAIEEALSFSEVDLEKIDYIEAHGTGTKLGDPIEIKALNNIFKENRNKIPVGSIKANIGHLDVASGLTSVIKSVYMLNNDLIPPNIYFKNLNSEISSMENKFYFPTELESKQLNNIGVSSFGLGGTNAHVILSKSISNQRICNDMPVYLLPISYLREEDLVEIQKRILRFLENDISMQDFVYTMSVGKKRFDENNIYFVFRDKNELIELLQNLNLKVLRNNETIQLLNLGLKGFKEIYTTIPFFKEVYSNFNFDDNSEKQYLYFKVAFIKFLDELEVLTCSNLYVNEDIDRRIIENIQNGNIEIIDSNINYDNNIDVINEDATRALFDFLGKVSVSTNIKFEKLYSGLNWGRIPVPNYPLKRKSFWIEADNHKEEKQVKNVERRISTNGNYIEEIIDIWKKNMDIDEIYEDDDFYDIGGDSLLAIDILDDINKRFSLKISLKDFIELTTPILINEFIKNNASKTIKKSFVTKIRTGKINSKNLFLIHPAGGTTFCYKGLNRFLDYDVNIYTIDLPDFYKEIKDMEELAKVYIDEILKIQNDSPYLIGGYSFGGNLAYEIATQMENRGKEIEQVLMFDSHPPVAYNSYSGEEVNYNKVLPMIVESYLKSTNSNLEKMKEDSEEEINKILKEAVKTDDLITEDDMKYFYDKWIYSHKLLKNHKPTQKLNAELVMFKANEKEDEFILNTLKIKVFEKEVWKNYCNGDMKVIDINGNHYSIFGDQTNLMYLSNKLNQLMNMYNY